MSSHLPNRSHGRAPARTRAAAVVRNVVCAAIATLVPLSALAQAYPLDSIPRNVSAGAQMPCSSRGLVRYLGDVIRYSQPALVHPAFRDRLQRMERVMRAEPRDHLA